MEHFDLASVAQERTFAVPFGGVALGGLALAALGYGLRRLEQRKRAADEQAALSLPRVGADAQNGITLPFLRHRSLRANTGLESWDELSAHTDP